MRDALRNLARSHRRNDAACLLAARIDKIHLALNALKTPSHIGLRRRIKKLEARNRIVELRKNLVKTRRRKIRKGILKACKSIRREERLLGILDKIDCLYARDECVKAPWILVAEHFKRAAALGADVGRHAADVLHHGVWIREDVRVDALENV